MLLKQLGKVSVGLSSAPYTKTNWKMGHIAKCKT